MTIEELERLKSQKDDAEIPKNVLMQIARTTLLAFCSNSFILSRVFPETKNYAKILEDKVKEVRDFLGKELVTVPYFSRGVLEIPIGPEGRVHCVISRQFYELVPYYGPPREPRADEITKLYQWLVVDGAKDQLGQKEHMKTFELEKSIQLFPDQTPPFVIGTSSPQMHASLQYLNGNVVPLFEDIEEFIMRRLITELVPEDKRERMLEDYPKHAALNHIKRLPKGPEQPSLNALTNYLTNALSA